MTTRVEAVYESGSLRLSNSVPLSEGAPVEVIILSNEEETKAQDDLEALAILAVGIGHDIQNPLGIMQMAVSRMKDEHQTNERITKDLEEVERQRKRIFDTVQIISFLRVGGDFINSSIKRTNLTELIYASIGAVKEQLSNQDIFIKVASGSFFIKAYSPMLELAFFRLIKNFVNAFPETDRKSGVIYINIKHAHHSKDMVVIEIIDKGRRLPQKDDLDLKDLFLAKSTQESNNKISLFLVQRIIRLHNGFINIQRHGDQGSTLLVYLPIG